MRLLGLLALLATPALAVDCREIVFDGAPFTVCEVDPGAEDLWLLSARDFDAAEAELGPLAFAMNGGMYDADRRPVGLFIREGRQETPLVRGAGPGNFGLVPNGVLCIEDGRARVIEAEAYAAARPACRYATQSGPMLVIDGALHPRFLPDSSSRHVRNGVGTSADGARMVFAISDRPVTFHHFARLFRDGLDLPQALYLDGAISRLHAPALGRSDRGAAMGPVIAVRATP